VAEAFKYAMGSGPLKIKLPKVAVKPAKCKITYSVAFPKDLKEIAKVNKDGEI